MGLSLLSPVILILIGFLFIALGWAFLRAEPLEFWKYWLLALPPLAWLLTAGWGSYFWLDWTKTPIIRNPGWVEDGIAVYLGLFVISALVILALFRGARLFASIYLAINTYMALATSFVTGMAVTGDWL